MLLGTLYLVIWRELFIFYVGNKNHTSIILLCKRLDMRDDRYLVFYYEKY